MGQLVTIVMPSFNTSKYIAETLESVISQTYTDWELIIVDDCSTDNTDEIVRPYLNYSRIKFFKNKRNILWKKMITISLIQIIRRLT